MEKKEVSICRNVRVFVPKELKNTVCARCGYRGFSISTYASFWALGYKVVCKACRSVHFHIIKE